jgi:hypothetical protein
MKRHHQFGTESGVASRDAAEQIRLLITDLARTIQLLDANIAAEQEGARAHDLSDDLSDEAYQAMATRRHNLMVTIAFLEDRLGSIENMRSRGHPPADHLPWLSGHR